VRLIFVVPPDSSDAIENIQAFHVPKRNANYYCVVDDIPQSIRDYSLHITQYVMKVPSKTTFKDMIWFEFPSKRMNAIIAVVNFKVNNCH